MASVGYDFNTGSFDFSERGILGTTGLGPVIKANIGLGLLRAIYEYRTTGIAAGALDVGPPARPGVMLAAMNVNTRISLLTGLTQTVLAADPGAPATLDNLSGDLDATTCHVIVIDGAYMTGDRTVACPEIKAWCEALGGTYSSEL